jgi:hypothetical protein
MLDAEGEGPWTAGIAARRPRTPISESTSLFVCAAAACRMKTAKGKLCRLLSDVGSLGDLGSLGTDLTALLDRLTGLL